MILAESPRRQTVSKLVSWGHWFAFFNIILALVIASIYVFSAPIPHSLLGQIFLFANWFGHISFITFISFVILILPFCYALENTRFVKSYASFVSALGLALLAFDALLFNRTGLHISLSSSELIVTETSLQIAAFSWQEWSFFSLLFVVWFGFQLLMANALWKRIERFRRRRIGQSVIALFLLSFVGSHGMHVWADARLYQPIMQQDNMFPLSYPSTAKTTLSRYGMLDLADYAQQKSVQFTYNIEKLDYPKEPLYCPIAQDKAWLVVYLTESIELDSQFAQNWSSAPYFRPMNNIETLVKTSLFSLPNLYHQYINDMTPVLIDVLSGYKLPINMYSPSNTGFTHNKTSTWDFTELKSALNANNVIPGVTFAYINAQQWSEISDTVLALSINEVKQHVLLLNPANVNNPMGAALSNSEIADTVMIDEDIVPSIFTNLGCDVDVTQYSTGQNAFAATRNWQITTQNNALILISDNTITEIKRNGLTKVTSAVTGNELNQTLNTDMFNRSIKHLSQFSQIK